MALQPELDLLSRYPIPPTLQQSLRAKLLVSAQALKP
jgi:hypothetical protein